jgi:GTPase subunit of restriction endonuclease
MYLSATQIKGAISRLGESRAKRTTLFDFLIVKRTLAIKAAESVSIAESEPAFIEALEEIGASGLQIPEHYYLNPFAIQEAGKSGFRPKRYRSNGTNSTIAGAPWQGVIALTNTKPRKASLRAGYEAELARLILASDEKKPLPSLTDIAVWYWRGQDVAGIVAGSTTDEARLEKLRSEFVSRVHLLPTEIAALFDQALDAPVDDDPDIFVDEKPDPEDYLPSKALPTEATPAENLAEVSFDLVAALTAKNFTILTGPSGTGKSRAALKLSEGLQRLYGANVAGSIFELVTVGPDWTSPKRLLGFRTPFGKERTLADGSISHDSYEITPTVRLILRASHSDAADIPHFLIFDEMNLSHVERYFAPFLSLMEAAGILDAESGVSLIDSDDLRTIARVLQDESPDSPEAAAARTMLAEGRDLILPPNLFFVGTVNIDETTYMFSPKVLDRAHVIELSAERPSSYLLAATREEPGGTIGIDAADELLKRSIIARETQKFAVSNPVTILDGLVESGFENSDIAVIKEISVKVLDGAYDLLQPVGFPFGYRVVKEFFVYLRSWMEAKAASGLPKAGIMAEWTNALDKALLQKVLPKIHGNRRALGTSLSALSAFLEGKDEGSQPPAAYSLGTGTKIGITAAGALTFPGSVGDELPLSRRKLATMHDRLLATGYISFVS